MELSPGTRLGPYEVLSLIGSGGMGEVYRAKDTRLERTIAIKVLPGSLSTDPENKKRFDREARSISSLSHPHICAVHDVGHQDGIDFLVMEFLEGETLAARLVKGPLPLEQVLRFGAEIADALDHAHRNGIIHRDLKPGNIILTKSGIKLLDFGLAKIAASRTEVNMLDLPTQQQHLTAKGYILGTIQYMSPEQLEGKGVDFRTDIFSFGTLLYEMASGQKAFHGDSPASIISAILNHTPESLSTKRSDLPESLDRIVQTCLAKNPDDRWQTAHDVALQLRWITEGTSPTGRSVVAPKRSKLKLQLSWILAVLFLISSVVLGLLFYRSQTRIPSEVPSSLQQFSIVLPENTVLNSLAISPDGKRLAYVVNGATGFSSLWLRSMDSAQPQEIPETGDATLPFWSPDSRSIGFFTGSEMKKWTIGGGPPETLCNVEVPKGGTWNQYGDILFSLKAGAGLYRISERGGEPTPQTTLDDSRKEVRHMFPHFLPDGRQFLYLTNTYRAEHIGVYVGSLDSTDTKLILDGLTIMKFVDPGYLLFARDNKLMVQHFDKDQLELTGEAVPITDNLSRWSNFSVSQNNILVYGNFDSWDTQPIWFDRSGKQSSPAEGYPSAIGQPGGYDFCDLSPDDKRLLTVVNGAMWMVDLFHASFVRYAMTNEAQAIFSPDDSQVVYAVPSQEGLDLYTRPSNGLGEGKLLYQTDYRIADLDWSADGKYFTFTGVVNPETHFDLFALPVNGERKPLPYLQTETREENAILSPDGKWVAYQSYQSGISEIYVRSFPEAEGLWAISTDGGEQPVWSRDGKELFYLTLDKKLIAVEVQTGEIFKPGAARFLFQTQTKPRMNPWDFQERKQYFVSSDGTHFLINTLIDKTAQTEINVLVNWNLLLKK